jgi:hypothetical protein
VAIKSKNIEFMSFFKIDRNVKRSHFLGLNLPRIATCDEGQVPFAVESFARISC